MSVILKISFPLWYSTILLIASTFTLYFLSTVTLTSVLLYLMFNIAEVKLPFAILKYKVPFLISIGVTSMLMVSFPFLYVRLSFKSAAVMFNVSLPFMTSSLISPFKVEFTVVFEVALIP